MSKKYIDIIQFIKKLYHDKEFIPLHAPMFQGNEKKYLADCIDTTFVSSVGEYVNRIEDLIKKTTGAKNAIAVVNGTAALHTALRLVGVNPGDEVLTQALTFVGTCNAIAMQYGNPLFIDVDLDSLSMSPEALGKFLKKQASIVDKQCINKSTGNRMAACIPMHTFGHPARMEELVDICNEFYIPVIEDAAESIGSQINSKHTGLFGDIGIISFNGNKTITTGGGGMIITNNDILGRLAKHITTTARIPHKWDFIHDMTAYNYRMPNINAAIGCAQLEHIDSILNNKRDTAELYKEFFSCRSDITFFTEREGTISNYWLNSIFFSAKVERDNFLEESNESGVMTRPCWTLMHKLPMFHLCQKGNLKNSEYIEERLVNIPSSLR